MIPKSNLFFKWNILVTFSRNIRRKYPIDTEKEKTLPVFDYGTSTELYRRVYVWGNIQTGALGMPYLKSSDNPETKQKCIKSPRRLSFAEKFKVTTAACGFGFTAFAVNDKSNVKVYGTGLNTDSQIGYHAVREGHPLEIIYTPRPIELPFRNPEKANIIKLSAGRAHLAILSNEGLFLLGNNAYGQCGRRIIENEDYLHSNFINYLSLIDDKKIIDVICGQDHTFVITEDNSVYSCGWGADGQTGLGFYKNCEQFTRLNGDIENEKIVKIACKSDFVLAINNNGETFGWGNAEYGQIITKDNSQQVCNPTYLASLRHLGKIQDAAAGGSFCTVVNNEGEVFVWGYGILGVGPNVQQSLKPLQIPQVLFGKNDFQPNSTVKKLYSGLSYSMAVTNLGDIFAWGRNTKCCLGLGDEKDQFFPFKVSLGGIAKHVSCGFDHTLAVCQPFI